MHDIFGSELARTAAVSVAMAIAGWGSHAVLAMGDQADLVQAHTVQIQGLQQGQSEAKKILDTVSTAIIKIDGKIDVINQKIDDDRAARLPHRASLAV